MNAEPSKSLILDNTLGRRIADLRGRRRLSQQQLAVAADVSVDLIRKLEQGQRHSARLETIAAIAQALDVPMYELLGVPTGLPGDRENDGAKLRAAIHDRAPAVQAAPTLDDLQPSIAELSELYWTGRFSPLAHVLPDVLAGARAAARDAAAADKAPAHRALAEVLQVAASLAAHLGYEDLAHVALLQALAAAETAEDPLLRAVHQSTSAWVLSRQGLWQQAERLAVAAAREVEPVLSQASPEQIAVWGELCHFGTIALAREGRGEEARELLALVQSAGEAIGSRRPALGVMLPFGRTFAGTSAVATAVATDQPREALRLADRVEHPETLPPSIHARFLLNIAYAQAVEWRSQESLDTLRKVDALAPEILDHHGLARAIVEEVAPRRHSQRLVGLASLARRLGVSLGE